MKDYTTGRAARELRVSQNRLRALCQAGMIAARATRGGHWRIPKSEVERLRRAGVPEPPPATPTESQAESTSGPAANPHRHPALLAEPSKDAIGAADKTVILENQVKSLHLAREKEQTLDWFRERQRNAAAAQREARRRSAEIEALRERKEWLDRWLDFALRSVLSDAPREIELDVQQSVEEALGTLDPEQPQHVVQRLVLAAVDKALRPWRRSKEIEQAVQEARQQIPWRARSVVTAEPSPWEHRAMQAAREAIAKLRAASVPEMRAAAAQAGLGVAREWEHQQACQRLVDSVFIFLPGGTVADHRAAQQAVKDGLDRLPVGASEDELQASKDAVLVPFRAVIAERQAAARAAAQAEQALWHVSAYIEKLAAADGGRMLGLGDFSARYDRAQDLKQRVRPVLTEKLKLGLLNEAEARKLIEQLVESELDLT